MPQFVIWFGYQIESKIAMSTTITLLPILVNALEGFATVERDRLDLMTSLHTIRWQTFWMIRPGRLPPHFGSGYNRPHFKHHLSHARHHGRRKCARNGGADASMAREDPGFPAFGHPRRGLHVAASHAVQCADATNDFIKRRGSSYRGQVPGSFRRVGKMYTPVVRSMMIARRSMLGGRASRMGRGFSSPTAAPQTSRVSAEGQPHHLVTPLGQSTD